jgi:hypothetical protein
MDLYTVEHVNALDPRKKKMRKEMAIRQQGKAKVMFQCNACSQIFDSKAVHVCGKSGVIRSRSFKAVYVSDTQPVPPRQNMDDMCKLRKLLHSITCSASAAATLQLLDEQKICIPDIPCGPDQRMALINAIEELGVLAETILERMEG